MKDIKKIFNKNAFSLIEVLIVIGILGVMVSVIHVVFVTNWTASQERIAQADLWQEAVQIIENITANGRESKTMNVSVNAGGGTKTADFIDPQGAIIAKYVMNNTGQLQWSQRGSNFQTLTTHLDFANSNFEKINNSKSLRISLALNQQVFNRIIHVDTSSEVYPRNP